MTSYASDYPDLSFDPAYKKYFEDFYATTDTPDAHEKYVEFFTPDATVVVASKRVKGKAEILALRKGMWEKVQNRLHRPLKVFPYGPNASEVMLFGTVQYGLKGGGQSSVDWAAYARLKKVNGSLKMDLYQVYLDTAAQSPAK